MSKKQKPIKKPVSGKVVADVPIVLQLESLECGAACLNMILAYYDRWVPLEVLRNECGVSRDGSNAASIFLCAQQYNLDVKAYKWEFEDLKNEGTFPCIAFWGSCHFIVIDGFKKDKVVVNDPSSGKGELDFEYFKKGFSGFVLTFAPNENFKPGGKKTSVLKFAKDNVKDVKKPIIILGIFSFLVAVIGIGFPLISRRFYDKILPYDVSLQEFLPFIITVGAIYLAASIFLAFQALYNYKVSKNVSEKKSTDFLTKLLSLPMSFFYQRFKGDVIERQKSSENITNTMISILAPLLINFLSLAFYLVVMFIYSWSLSLIGIVSVVVNTIVSLKISNRRVDAVRIKTRDNSRLNSGTVFTLEMMETIKSSGAENTAYNNWSNNLYLAMKSTNKVNSKNSFLNLIPQFISTALGTLIVGLGTVYVILGIKTMNGAAFTIGIVTSFQGFYEAFSAPVMKLIQSGQSITEMRTDMERINDVYLYESDPNIAKNEDKPTIKLTGDISLEHVTFGYAKLADPLIKDLSIHIKPGQKVAFVGSSGCGKSTLANVISGLYEIWEGKILFDGHERKDLSRATFSNQISVVDQNIVLFPDTIKNNLTLWNEKITDEDIQKAAEDAQIMDFINQREEKFEHILKDNGGDFSGGQRQCLEIARGLANNPSIFILDEATSALDAKTEDEVIRAIKKRHITTILIAHRLSTIRDADQIFVMKKGAIVERGTHDELMALNGEYTKLINNN